MLQLNTEQLKTLLNACEMARAELMNKITLEPFWQGRKPPTLQEYERYKTFPYKNENVIRWEKSVDVLTKLISLIEQELNEV